MKKDSVLANYMARHGQREAESVISGYFKMIGRRGGKAKSKAKAASSSENGKLGGRPRKPLKPAAGMP
jgi:hypothetical protein